MSDRPVLNVEKIMLKLSLMVGDDSVEILYPEGTDITSADFYRCFIEPALGMLAKGLKE